MDNNNNNNNFNENNKFVGNENQLNNNNYNQNSSSSNLNNDNNNNINNDNVTRNDHSYNQPNNENQSNSFNQNYNFGQSQQYSGENMNNNSYANTGYNGGFGSSNNNYESNNSNFSYENQGFNSFDENFKKGNPFNKKKKPKKQKEKSPYVSKQVFIVGIIVCMVISFAFTYLGLKYLDVGSNTEASRKVSATNYNLAKNTDSKMSVEEIIAKNENAVVEIKTEEVATDSWLTNYVKEGAGSGVIIDSKGYIMTCNHVIADATNITVTLKNGKEYSAKVVGKDSNTDIAVLKIKGDKFTAATYGNSKELVPGNLVVAIGNPLGQLGGSASAGIISALDREIELGGRKMTLLQTDTSINPGNSGGGLFDGNGNLVGIVVAKSAGASIEGIGFAIPIDKAAEIAKSLIEDGKVKGRAVLGVTIVDVSDAETAMKLGVKNTGVYITDVTGKLAKKSGFEKGDMIYYVGDTKIESSSDLFAILEKHKPGDKLEVTVVRNNKTATIKAVLDEA